MAVQRGKEHSAPLHTSNPLSIISLTCPLLDFFFFFFNDTATTEIYTLSLHDALPILHHGGGDVGGRARWQHALVVRSEEHTSELQSQSNLVCRLLLEKKKNQIDAA